MNHIYYELPELKHEKHYFSDAGYDLMTKETIIIFPGEVKIINTGVSVDLKEGYYGRIAGRSSWNSQGLICTGGVIDSGYTGEIKVGLFNSTKKPIILEKYTRIAQLIIETCDLNAIQKIGKAPEKNGRGKNGFGSTNKA